MDQTQPFRKSDKYPQCYVCGCPLANLVVNGVIEGRRKCVRCRAPGDIPPPSGYGKRPLEVRLKRRAEKTEWARKNAELIKARRQARIAADPEKHKASIMATRRRTRRRIRDGLPCIRDIQVTEE